MPTPTPHPAQSHLAPHERIRLQGLIRIRWAAPLSLGIIFLLSNYLLHLGIDYLIVIELTAVGLLSNLILVTINQREAIDPLSAGGIALLFDVLLLTILLAISGGYTNPFSMVFLAYVTLAAVVLDSRWTWRVFAVSMVCFSSLFLAHIPLPLLFRVSRFNRAMNHIHHPIAESGFSLHLYGMLLAFVSSGAIVAWFVTRMNREIAEQARLIESLRKREDERRRLTSLATLTAGVTHELATPIATLSLISEDLASELREHPGLSDDAALLQSEVARCGAILSRLRASNSELQGEAPIRCVLSDLVASLKDEFVNNSASFAVRLADPNTLDIELYTLRHGLLESLRALIRNALQACLEGAQRPGRVELFIASDGDRVSFKVSDSGCGIASDLLERIGEPFFTSKPPGEGLGLGVYLTKLFANQVGGELYIASELALGSEFVLEIPKEVVL